MDEDMNDEFEEYEVDVVEFSLDGEEIEYLMEKLRELKETKESFEFELDDENVLKINYHEDDEDEEW